MKIKRKQQRKPLRVLGIDQALDNTGFVLLEDGKMTDFLFYAKTLKLFKANKYNAIHHKNEPSTAIYKMKRLFWLMDELRELVGLRFMPDIVVMEDYAFTSKSQSTYQIGEWGGHVRSIVLKELLRPLYVCEPKKLKKFATGNGNATKTMMVITCLKEYGIDFSIFETAADNLADAFFLAMYGTILEWLRCGKKKLDDYPAYVRDTLNAPSLAIAGRTNLECGPITPEMVLKGIGK